MPVRDEWARILAWGRAHVPDDIATVAPGATSEEIDAVDAHFPRPWPSDLREWYQVQNGCLAEPGFAAVPDSVIFPLDQIVPTHRTALATMGNFGPKDEAAEEEYAAEFERAGTAAGFYLPSYVPICDYSHGWQLFVDLRNGPLSGCVRLFEPVDADDNGPPIWPSVTAMLADIADALENSRRVYDSMPTVHNGRLVWTMVDDM